MAEDFNPILEKQTGTYDPFRSVKDIPLIPIQEDEVFKPYASNAENFLSFLSQIEDNLSKKGLELYPKGKSDKVSFKNRLLADFKEGVSKTGEIGYVKNIYGENNVFSDNEGNIVFRDEPGASWEAYNPKFTGENFEEIFIQPAEMASEMVQFGPALFSSNPLTVSLTMAAGEGALQYISSQLPGEENLTTEDRALKIISNGVLGGSTQWATNGFLKWVTSVNPVKNFATKNIVKTIKGEKGSEARVFYEEGLRLQDKYGPLSLAEISGDKFLRQIEDFLRGYYLTRGQGADLAFDQIGATAVAIQKMMKTLYGQKGGPLLGNKISTAYNDILDNLIKNRQIRANNGFDDLTKLVDKNTGKVVDFSEIPIMNTTNFVAKLDELIKQYKPKGTGDSSMYKSLLNARASLLDDTKGEGVLTALEFQNLISQYSAAAAGTGSVFKDLATAAQKRPARELLDALNKDINQTIESGVMGNVELKGMSDTIQSSIAAKLAKVRDNYKADSDLIKGLEDSFLSSFIQTGNKSADDIVKQFSTLSAQETDEAIKFLYDNGYDDVIQQIKATIIEDAFVKSMRPIEDLTLEAEKLAKATRVGTSAFDAKKSNKFDPMVFKDILDPTKFMQNLNKTLKGTASGGKGKAEVLFSKTELKEIGDVLEYIRRANFSRVSPKASMLDIVLGFVNLPGLVARAGGMNYLSKLLLTKQGRDGLENFIALQTGEKQLKDLTKNMAANVVFFTESMMDYQTEFATTGSAYGQEFLEGVKEKAEEIIPKIYAPESEFIAMENNNQNLQSFNVSSPEVSRGQGADVVPPLSAPINANTVASLESMGMPLFNAAEGGIVELFDSKQFKKPQVVA
tara:strand:+ start:1602 stop:4160 length:2559 start_codon:yes stop_codon:yes gene_type:complete